MDTTLDPTCYTVLQLMLARNLFIGDEVRVSTMRTSWSESGQAPESFGNAIAQLKDSGFIRVGHSTAGPVAQLTKQGFSLGQQKRQAPAVERRATPQTTPAPPIQRRRRVEYLNSPRIAEQHTTETSKPQAPAASQHAQKARANVTHAGVFSTQAGGPPPIALQLCVLGSLRNRRIRANGQLDYACVLEDWMRMDLRHDDLLLAIKRLSEQGELETINHPKERVLLTQRGIDRYENPPKSMDDGMHRWQAKKCLRATKRLGALPAA
jgi:hypothetical protein